MVGLRDDYGAQDSESSSLVPRLQNSLHRPPICSSGGTVVNGIQAGEQLDEEGLDQNLFQRELAVDDILQIATLAILHHHVHVFTVALIVVSCGNRQPLPRRHL